MQKHHPATESGDLRTIASYIQNHRASPENLFFFYFARRGRYLREMTRETFTIKTDD